MELKEIEALTARFYKAISFTHNHVPSLANLQSMFYGSGILINNSFATPIGYTVESYLNYIEAQVAGADMKQLLQREVSGQTEVFGKVAQRISVYEYTLAEIIPAQMPRGVNYIQYIQTDAGWRIVSMSWCDENENHLVPDRYITPNTNSLESEYMDS
ncbi:hypothetical protein GCM10027037_09740 [Mucilaginibacter koreensis]